MMEGLTEQQRRFVDEYVSCLNGAEAARRAGYSEKTARFQASRLLTNVNIRAEIDARLAESAMPKTEILFRLTEHARGSMADFLRPKGRGMTLDLRYAANQGALHLVKKYSKTKQGVSIELYDGQDALALLARCYGLLVDRLDINDVTDYSDVSPSERKTKLQAELERLTAFEAWECNTDPAAAGSSDAESGVADEPAP